jgi:hypothetical protein
VRAVPVVVMEPVSERCGALLGGGVRLGVSPLPEAGLDEALGLAVITGQQLPLVPTMKR